MDFSTIFEKLYEMTAFSNIAAEPSFLIMYALGFLFLYLGIAKHYEPLLLIPIAMGILLANFPGGEMGVFGATDLLINGVNYHNVITLDNGNLANSFLATLKDGSQAYIYGDPITKVPFDVYHCSLPQIAHDLGLMNMIYYWLIKTGFIPPVIFMGVGAMTDFGPMLRNLKLAIFGAAAQVGIFSVILVAVGSGAFTPQEAGALGIIGGADGPTAIYTTIKLAPHLLGPIAIAAYSYMALVPVIIPLVVKLCCTKKELEINMKEQDKLYPNKLQIKNLRVAKIIFPIFVTVLVAIIVPSAVSLIGMLMFGNLIKEIGADTSRIADTASNALMNIATIFLGLSVGATMTVQSFLNWQTIGIVAGGFCAFAVSIAGGIFLVKLFNLFTKKKINPLVGACGLSAVPMASRVANDIATKINPKNNILNYCMSANISGVIGSAVAAGVLIAFLR
jgi:oxaloacetate decarboxylase beta subunit